MKITADILEQAREALVDATNQKITLISAIKEQGRKIVDLEREVQRQMNARAQAEAGDLLLVPVDWSDPRIVELAQVERRPAGTPLTIFKSGGLGVEDVIAAAFVYERLK